MSRLLGVFLASVCAFATLAVSRPAAAQVYYSGPVTTYYAPSVAAPVVANYPVATTAYYAPTTAYYAPAAAPVTSYYAPTTAYYAPATTAYYAPTTAYYAPSTAYYAPTTAYYAPTSAYYAPTPYAAGYVGAPVYVRSSYYVPFQPVRNFFRSF